MTRRLCTLAVVPEEIQSTDRILTVPNAVTAVRLLCVPWFLWLLFGADSRVGAAILLAVLGSTDWVDGKVARRLGQVSDLGKILDPTADRILLGVAVVALWADGAVPGIVFWPVIVREVLISVAVLVMAAIGAERIDVLWVGKAGAFGLMFAFPFFLLAHADTSLDGLWEAAAWFCAIPGVVFGYVAAAEYARAAPAAVRAGRTEREAAAT